MSGQVDVLDSGAAPSYLRQTFCITSPEHLESLCSPVTAVEGTKCIYVVQTLAPATDNLK